MKKIADFERTLLWSSMRYFMGSQTIVAACWPADFITNYKDRLTPAIKRELFIDLNRHFNSYRNFGHQEIDSPRWEKLMHYLSEERYEVIAEGNDVPETKFICFKSRDTYYEVSKYEESPGSEIYIYPPFIKSITLIKENRQ